MGQVDNCVANAGTSGKGAAPIHEMPTAEWRRMMSVNLDGAFFTMRAAAKHMVERGQGGSIVAMASSAAIEGAARNAHYGATKGALCAMIRAMAVELARYKVRCNSILPGWISTNLTAGARTFNPELEARVVYRTPAGRWGEPADLAGMACFLAAPASDFVTGTAIPVDGGYSIHMP